VGDALLDGLNADVGPSGRRAIVVSHLPHVTLHAAVLNALLRFDGSQIGRLDLLAEHEQVVKVVVGWPERKVWWRNLLGDGASVRMRIQGREYSDHAVARGDEHDGVTVEVTLAPRDP